VIHDFHIDARHNFDNRATELVEAIAPFPIYPGTSRLQPPFYTHHTIEVDPDRASLRVHLTTTTGVDVAVGFVHDSGTVGLSDTSLHKYHELSEAVQRSQNVSSFLSTSFVEESLFEWLRKAYLGRNHQSFCAELLLRAQQDVRPCIIWVPIPFTSSTQDFVIGRIEFRVLTPDLMDQWFRAVLQDSPQDEDGAKKRDHVTSVYAKYQGFLAGTFSCEAEPIRAKELAYGHLANSLAILRLISPANFAPEIVSGAYEYGEKMISTQTYFVTNPNLSISKEISTFLNPSIRWTVDQPQIDMLKSVEFSAVHGLLTQSNLNDFQRKLLDALVIYSKNTLRQELYDRLLYILVALESLLLKNESEPIQQNIADRIAFAIAKTAQERTSVVKTVKAIYDIRSRYLHHGAIRAENLTLVREFMELVWIMFFSLIQNAHRFKTPQQCVDALDKIKYS